MGIKQKIAEQRVRAAIKGGDGRALLDRLSGDSDALESVLNEMGPAAAPALIDAIRVARTDDESSYAIYKAGQAEDPRALDAVRAVLRQGAPYARRTAIATIDVHGTAEDCALIAECLTHPDEDVRRFAFETLNRSEEYRGAGYLPVAVAAALAAERARQADEASAARAAKLAGPFTATSAAVALVGLCDEIDTTYVDPIPADADDRRTALRADIALVGERVNDQGGEDFMREVVTLVASASIHGSYLSREWSGIGGWLG